MAGIWINSGTDETRWTLGAPRPFPDEKTLHGLIAENPQLLPLAGSPQLTILGSEVQLGTRYADILAVEPSGRPAIIEVKLAKNSEARRAIVAQVLAYAAFLQGLTVENLEQENLQAHLSKAGYGSILEAVQANDQDREVDADSFSATLQEFLDHGNFRLVLVLDDTSDELERILAYMDAMTIQALTIDLITMSIYEVNGAQIALPQPVVLDLNATRTQIDPSGQKLPARRQKRVRSEGSDAFRHWVDEEASGEGRETLDRIVEWAGETANLLNIRLISSIGVNDATLLPKIRSGNVSMVQIGSNRNGGPWLFSFRGVFERRAPNSIDVIEKEITPDKVGGLIPIPATDEVLEAFLKALTAAYREATGAPPLSPPQEPPA